MKFLIISHALHKTKEEDIFSYSPYVREMNIWLKYVDSAEIVAPLGYEPISNIDMAYQHRNLRLTLIPNIEFTSLVRSISSFLKLPIIFYRLFKACKKADHIHLRCPGNIGLLGCLVQIFFPNKIKTAKYAGNWDPNAQQSLSYRFQKWILSNTYLTRNIKVLVYGDWPNQSKNIKPFFTASYSNLEIEKPLKRDYSGDLKFVFVGTLVDGKRPSLAVQIIEAFQKKRKNVFLEVYGDGVLKPELQNYIDSNGLEKTVKIFGNQSKDTIKEALKNAHFIILASKSEGWPKAIAEAMFFGVIPIATAISCVPNMLDYGNRGLLIEPDLNLAKGTIANALNDVEKLKLMSENATKWSQQYTMEVFENNIIKVLKP